MDQQRNRGRPPESRDRARGVSEAVPVTWALRSGSGVTSTDTDAIPGDDWGNVRTLYGTCDRDASYWVGTAAAPPNLAGLGLGNRINDPDSEHEDPLTIDLTSGVVNSLLFSASLAGHNDDAFKIKSPMAGPTRCPYPGPSPWWAQGSSARGCRARAGCSGNRRRPGARGSARGHAGLAPSCAWIQPRAVYILLWP